LTPVDVDEDGVVFDLACVIGGPLAKGPTASPVAGQHAPHQGASSWRSPQGLALVGAGAGIAPAVIIEADEADRLAELVNEHVTDPRSSRFATITKVMAVSFRLRPPGCCRQLRTSIQPLGSGYVAQVAATAGPRDAAVSEAKRDPCNGHVMAGPHGAAAEQASWLQMLSRA
jgi:hypothetical protein